MNKVLKIVISFVIMVSVLFLVGCSNFTDLGRLERKLNEAVSISNNIDNVENVDLQDNNVANLSVSQNDFEIIPLSIQNIESDLTIKELLMQIKAKQQSINEKKEELKQLVSEVKQNIKDFRSNGGQLTDDEKTRIRELITEAKTINSDFKATIGNVYYKMYKLRGKYNYANRELIKTTFEEVLNEMSIRIDCLEKIDNIINEVNSMII